MKRRSDILLAVLFMCFVLVSCSSSDSNNSKQNPENPNSPKFERTQESKVMDSKVLFRPIKYSVLLPEGYDKGDRRYSVVYLLHGYGDNENSWLKGGKIQMHADRAVNSGISEPYIFIMPSGDNSYYVNKYNGGYDYMTMITKELVPHIDANYRTLSNKDHRAVMGYSMGGYGAYILPSKNPNVFSTSVALSMSWRTDAQYKAEPQGVFDSQFGSIFGGQGSAGEGRITEYFKDMSPFHYLEQANIADYKTVNYFLDCGDDEEQLSITNDALHQLMREKDVKHEYRMRNGAHNWDYWSDSMEEAMRFIQTSFTQGTYPEESVEVATKPNDLKGTHTLVQLDGVSDKCTVYLPTDYASSGMKYPVIYFMHDYLDTDRDNSVAKVLSLVEKAHVVAGLYKSVVVEIPTTATLATNFFQKITQDVDSKYSTIASNDGRIILTNNKGGELLDQMQALANAYYLYNAKVDPNTLNLTDGFYYLDITDGASPYAAYGTCYQTLRDNSVKHEYRVRNGNDSYSSFLNGLDESFPFMNKYLAKPYK